MYTNACSVGNKWAELIVEAGKSEMIALTETWLRPDVDIRNMCPADYTMYRNDRADGRTGGGTLLLVAHHILQEEDQSLSLVSPNVQVSSCRAHVGNTSMTVVCVYRSPSSTALEDEDLLLLIDRATRVNGKLLVVGDFNAPEVNWQEEHAPQGTFGSRLLDAVQNGAIVQHVDDNTRWREGQRPTKLDLVLTKGTNDIRDLEIAAPLGKSDHAVIHIRMAVQGLVAPDKRRRNFGKIDTTALVTEAAGMIWPDTVPGNIEAPWGEIKANLRALMDRFAPLRNLRRRGKPPWWRARAERAQRHKRCAWKRFRHSGSHRRFLEYQRLQKRANQVQRECRVAYERKLAKNAKTNPKAYFNYVQSKAAIREGVGWVRNTEGICARSNMEKAETLRTFFESVHRVDSGQEAPPVVVQNVPTMDEVVITEEEVCVQLEALNKTKAAGPDEIHPAILRPLASLLAKPMASLFNRSLQSARLPGDWKVATVSPIHKGGDKNNVGNYRPVSLTSVPLKIMERIIRDKVVAHIVRYGLLSNAQHGFRSKRSCLTNLLAFLDEITDRLDQGDEVEVCYLDFQKAFDSVNHRFLLLKLEALRVHPAVLEWIKEFLGQRTFHVRVDGVMSSEARIASGVPQGSVLGPLLFLLYVNDLAGALECPTFLFADDVKLVGDPRNQAIQRDLDTVHRWTVAWDLPLNIGKCKQLVKAESTGPTRWIGIPGAGDIRRAPDMKDLGVFMSGDFKLEKQCRVAAQRANRALYQLLRTVVSRDPEILVPLYKVYVRPHLEYCVQAWSPYLERDKKVLEAVQRRFTRSFPQLRDNDYQTRLRTLNLFSLRRRRLRGDLIETFKCLKNITDTGRSLFTISTQVSLRGHSLKLEKRRCRLEPRAKFLGNRVVNAWNKLPAAVVETTSVISFKRKLDDCWQSVFPELE